MRASLKPGHEQPAGPCAGVVLDAPPTDESAERHLRALVLALFEGGVSHLSLVGAGAKAAPDSWPPPGGQSPFALSARVDLAGHGEAHHYISGSHRLTLLPEGAGRAVVVAAARRMAGRTLSSTPVEAVDAAVREIAGPPADLVIVTGGAMSLRGAYTWTAAYAEFIFLAQPWRELAPEDVVRALREFAQRSRRFGGIAVAEAR